MTAAQVRGSETRPKALNLTGGALAASPGQRSDVLPTPPATPVAKSSRPHQLMESPSAAGVQTRGSGNSVPGKGESAPPGPSLSAQDLTVPGSSPSSIPQRFLAGNNLLPVTLADPETGEISLGGARVGRASCFDVKVIGYGLSMGESYVTQDS